MSHLLTSRLALLPALAFTAFTAGGSDTQTPPAEAWAWDLPAHFTTPRVPADNPMSEAKFQLGRHLFYDTRLSTDETFACASCHLQEFAFADNVDRPLGATGDPHPRSSMSLANVAFASPLNWANPLVTRLEDQAMTPMFGDNPVELGTPEIDVLAPRLRTATDIDYEALFAAAFPDVEGDRITLQYILYGLASFQRGILSTDAPIDRYFAGDRDAISPSAKRGMDLFHSERLECFHCHGGPIFSASLDHNNALEPERPFHNNGLFNIDGLGAYPAGSEGVFEITGKPDDMGRFRAPSLRNITVTAPYMHDGSMLDLDEVIDHYARGGRLIEDGPHAGDGALSPLRSPFIPGFRLDDDERADLHAFFEALTDESFLANPRYASPFDAPDATPSE